MRRLPDRGKQANISVLAVQLGAEIAVILQIRFFDLPLKVLTNLKFSPITARFMTSGFIFRTVMLTWKHRPSPFYSVPAQP